MTEKPQGTGVMNGLNVRTAGPEKQYHLDQRIERLPDGPDANQLGTAGAAVVRIEVCRWHDNPRKAHLYRFTDAKRRLRDAANLATQTNFAEDGGGRRQAAIAYARGHCRRDAQVR